MIDDLANSWLIERPLGGPAFAVRRVPNKVVTIDVWVATGSAREDDATNGISHFLEHMLFKGTPRFGVGELDRHIMQLGGVWNAGTSMDFTHYYVTVAAPYFDDALDAIADMIQHASIDPAEFEKERAVILEEFRRKQDDPWGWLFDELYHLTYEKGPYRRTVIGTFESISRLTREMMVDYYRRTYTADAITVLIAGDVEPDAAVARAKNYFRDLAPAANPWPQPDPNTAFRKALRQIVPRDVHETYLALTWPGPSIESQREVVALEMLATILGTGRSSRLTRRLREELGLVEEVGMSVAPHKYPGLAYAYATLQPQNLEPALDQFLLLVRELPDKPPTEAELQKAKRLIRNDFFYSTETNSGQTGVMGYYMTLTGSEDFYYRYLPLVESITVADLVDTANRYFLAHEPVALAAVPPSAPNAPGEEVAP
jgi:predicted Zn-dependent peptidase